MSTSGGEATTVSGVPTTVQSPSARFLFTPDAGKQSILNRKLRSFTSITKDTFAENLQKEKDAFTRRATAYRVHADKHYHNSRRLEHGQTFWDNGKIVDRGKGKGTSRQTHGSYNPITNTWVVPPTASGPDVSGGDDSYKRQRAVADRCTLGKYNPILHHWQEKPNEEEERKREKFYHTQYGFMTPQAHKKRLPCPQGVFDPIKAEWIKPPEENEKLMTTVGTMKSSGRKFIVNGEHWGQHDPILSKWSVLPESPKYKDPELVAMREAGVVPLGRRKTAVPRDQGVYDPVRNEWVVLPENTRIYEGQSFAPVSHATFR